MDLGQLFIDGKLGNGPNIVLELKLGQKCMQYSYYALYNTMHSFIYMSCAYVEFGYPSPNSNLFSSNKRVPPPQFGGRLNPSNLILVSCRFQKAMRNPKQSATQNSLSWVRSYDFDSDSTQIILLLDEPPQV